MSLNLQLPEKGVLRPKITVIGVGGAGGNAVNNMISSKLEGVEFVVANTDAQALEHAYADKKIQLGERTTKGLGAGAAPEVGGASAQEAIDEIKEHMQDANMVFITAGMGGGTGTGAAPVIAKAAKEMDILTVGVVTKPFHFEGIRRMRTAESGLLELQKYVDTLIVIPNQNLFRIANENTTFADAFKMADNVLHAGIRSVTDLMIMPGLINLDFADVRAVMLEMGKAMMGTGEAEGERRAIEAAEAAISNPLLDNASMRGARGVLISITGGSDLTLFEVDEAANRIREEVDPDANIIFGSTFNEGLEGKMRVSVVATGIDAEQAVQEVKAVQQKTTVSVNQSVPQEAPAVQEEQPQVAESVKSAEEQQEAAAEQDAFAQIKADLEQEFASQSDQDGYQYSIEKLNAEFSEQAEQQPEETGEKRIFVPNAAVEPESFERDVAASIPAAFENASEEGESDADADAAERRAAGGFFSRVMQRAARSFQGERKDAVREPELAAAEAGVTAAQTNSGEAVAVPSQQPLQEDLLDIPAFLRRK